MAQISVAIYGEGGGGGAMNQVSQSDVDAGAPSAYASLPSVSKRLQQDNDLLCIGSVI